MATALGTATAIAALRSPMKAVSAPASLLGYKGEGPNGNLERQRTDGAATNELEAMAVDELFFNNTGGSLAAGDWVGHDLTALTTDDYTASPNGIHLVGMPDAALLRRMKQAPAGSENVVGILMETTAPEAWGRVRRFGPVSANLNGVTPNMDATLAVGGMQALQIHGSTAGKATQAPPTVVGTLEVASGQSTGTASVGTLYNGRPAFAVLNEVDGTVSVVAAVVAAGTLTVTLSGNTTGDRTVAYRVEGPTYPRPIGYQLAYDVSLKYVHVSCL